MQVREITQRHYCSRCSKR